MPGTFHLLNVTDTIYKNKYVAGNQNYGDMVQIATRNVL